MLTEFVSVRAANSLKQLGTLLYSRRTVSLPVKTLLPQLEVSPVEQEPRCRCGAKQGSPTFPHVY
jgi:hypothetical protein